jgi:hypothetical protein
MSEPAFSFDMDFDFDLAEDLFVEIDQDTILPDRKWMEEHLWISTKAGTIVPFRLNPIQIRIDEAIQEAKNAGKPLRFLILKARQMGCSTYAEALGYGITRLNKNHSAGIIGNEAENSNHLYSMYELYHRKDEGAPTKKRHNRKALLFEENHGSQVIVTTAMKANAATGHTNQFVHCSEVTKWRDAATTMDSLLPTIPKPVDNKNACCIMETTAFGATGYFYRLWTEAVKGNNGWMPLFYAWFEDPRYRMEVGSYPLNDVGTHPRYNEYVDRIDDKGKEQMGEETRLREEFGCTDEQLTWRRWMIDNDANGDLSKFHQENPATWREAFLSSGRPRFDIRILEQWEEKAPDPIWVGDVNERGEFIEGDGDHIKVWHWPEKGEEYVIGGDCAEGSEGGDYSAASVFSRRSRAQCAVIHGHLGEFESDAYGLRLQKMGFKYNTALIAPEINAYGLAVVEWLLKKKYPNIYYHTTKGEKGKKPLKKAGWRTQTGTKELLISDLAAAIRDETIEVNDIDTIQELIGYMILPNGKLGCDDSDEDAYDDRVIGVGVALQALAYDMDSVYRNWHDGVIVNRG